MNIYMYMYEGGGLGVGHPTSKRITYLACYLREVRPQWINGLLLYIERE